MLEQIIFMQFNYEVYNLIKFIVLLFKFQVFLNLGQYEIDGYGSIW